jgi:copper resistance protein B
MGWSGAAPAQQSRAQQDRALHDEAGQTPVHDHASMHAAEHMHSMPEAGSAAASPEPYLRPPTAAERAQAFPDLGDSAHAMHEDPFTTFVLFDRLEVQRSEHAEGADTADWDVEAWAGHSLSRLWIRSEGERRDGRTEDADLELLFGRAFSPWWDYVAGVREDFRPDPSTAWAAFGVHGLAPYRFEVDATAYLGEGGRTAARVETEYELLMTNRLILQPRIELNWYGDDMPRHGIGAGLADAEIGLRLRYEIRREVAPYVGISRASKIGRTADFARAAGEDPRETRIVAGIRVWF